MKFFYKLFFLIFFISPFDVISQTTANFTYTFVNGSQCVPAIVNFTNTSTGNPGPLTYLWSFQDGNPATSILSNPTVLFSPCGSKTVTLTTTNASGATDVKTTTLFIACKPEAKFSVTPNSGCPPLNAQFTNLSVANSGTLQSLQWDFCDGVLSSLANPTHIYTTQGCYCTKLIAINSWGCSNDTTVYNNICVTQAPVVVISTLNPPSNCAAPYTVNFSGLNSSPLVGLTYSWQFFGTGVSPSTSTSPTPSVTYNSFGSYSVKLTVTLPNGCSSTITLNNYVNIAVNVANFTASALNICEGSTVAFNGSPAISYNWIITPVSGISPAPPQTIQSPSFTFSNSGSFDVCLTLTFNGGCTAQKCTTIVVNPKPTADFLINGNLNTCQPPVLASIINNSSLGPGITYQWSFIGGVPASSTSQNPGNINYSNCGSYGVSLIVSNQQGCSDDMSISPAVIIDCPVASFIWNIPTGLACSPYTVPFTNASTGNPTIWKWNFDYISNPNNFVSSGANPTHTYLLPGCYTVGLIIENSQGCKDTLIITDAICLGMLMSPCFSVIDTEVCASDAVTFVNCTTPAPPYPTGAVVTHKWLFDDGGTSTAYSPIHIFADTGTFTITLIECYNGCCDTLIKPDYIIVSPPIANLIEYYDCDNPQQVTLSAHQSVGGDIFTWTIPSATNIQYITPDSILVTWPMPNPNASYTVSVNVSNIQSGCSQDISVQIFLRDLNARFKFIDSIGCSPYTSSIFNTTTGAYVYQWKIFNAANFVVAQSSAQYFNSGASPGSYTWSTPGNYNVRLIATAYNGCLDTAYQIIKVYGLSPGFTASSNAGCPPLIVNFTNTTAANSVSNPVSYEWNFGDTPSPNTVQSTLVNPTHTYNTVDTFNVSLIVTDNHGCKDTLLIPGFINVTLPISNFIALDSSVCLGEIACFFNFSIGNNLAYIWDFGDIASGINNTSTLPNPCHLYTSPGFKTIKLIVLDPNGCTDTLIKTAYINIGNLSGSFVANVVTTNCPPLVVSFNNTTIGAGVGSTYYWNFGDGVYSVVQNPQHIYSVAGDFTVSLFVTNSSGCTDTIIYTNYIHIGGANAVASLTSSIGCSPLNVCFNISSSNSINFIWNLGDSASFADDTAVCHTYSNPGIFRAEVFLNDGVGCVYLYFIDSIFVVADTSFFSVTTNDICAGGFVQFHDSSNAITPFTLLWDFGLTGSADTSTFSDPIYQYNIPGDFIVTLTSVAQPGCADTWIDTIHVTPPPVVDFTYLTSGLCQSSTVQFSGSIFSLSPIANYQWNFDDPLSGALNFSTLLNPMHIYNSPGSFDVILIVIASNGCSDTIVKNITINPLPIALTNNDTSICIGGSVLLNGVGGITYLWSPSISLSSSTSATVLASPITNTTYTLIVTDNLGCQGSALVVVNLYQLPISNAGVDASVCENDTIQLSGGGGVSYLWSPSISLNNNTVSNPFAYPIVNTLYQLTVTDVNGCVDVDNVSITVVAAPIAMAGIDTSICFGTSGVIHASGNGVYQWGSIPIGFNSIQVNPIVSPTITTIYILKVTDGNGCFDRDTIIVTVNPLPIANAGNDTSICNGNSFQLNGTGGSLYSWSPSIGLSSSVIANPIANPLISTTYLLNATDGVCFSSSDSMIVIVNPLPLASVLGVQPICPGSNLTLQASGALFYSWSPSATLNSNTLSNPIASPVNSTIYTVVVTDLNGCIDDTSVAVTILPGPIANAGNDVAICIGQNTQLNGSGGVSYLWAPGLGLNATNASTPIATPSITTSYILTVTDATSCVDNDTVVVTVNPLPIANAGNDTSICVGQTAQFHASGGSSFFWSPSTNLNANNIYNPIATPSITSTYFVSVTNGNLCIASDSIVLSININPLVNAGQDTSVCSEDTIQLNVVGGISFAWSPVVSMINSTSSSPLVYPAVTTIYSVTVTDINGCTNSDDVLVVWLPPPIANAGIDTELCVFDTIQLNASGGISYLWSPSTALSDFQISNPFANPVVSQTYTVLVTDALGCTKNDALFILVNTLPPANAGLDITMCSGTSIYLNGSGGLIYNWQPGASLSDSSIANPIAFPDSPLVYILNVIDTNGCKNSDSVQVSILYSFNAIVKDDTCICLNDATELWATVLSTVPYYYSWSPVGGLSDATINNPIASPTLETTYTVIVYDGQCYADTDSVVVCVYELPEVFSGYDQSIIVGNSTVLQASTIDQGYFIWEPDSTLSCSTCLVTNAFPIVSTSYIITITDYNTCKDKDTTLVSVVCTDASLFVPNAFTPNGDGLNDEFELEGVGIASLTYIRIFNRWGEIVFESNSLAQGWNGYFKEKMLSPDVYIYYMEAVCSNGQTIRKQGNITLIL